MGPAVWVTFSNCYKQWWKVALSYCIRDTDREIGTDYQLLHMAIDWDNRRHIYEKKKKRKRGHGNMWQSGLPHVGGLAIIREVST